MKMMFMKDQPEDTKKEMQMVHYKNKDASLINLYVNIKNL